MLPQNRRRSGPLTPILAVIALLVPALVAAEACSKSEESGGGDPCAGELATQCGQTCSATEPCATGLFCGTDGRCTAECTTGGNQCGSGEECAGGRCVPDDGIDLTDAGDTTNYTGGSVPLEDGGRGE